MSTMTAESVLPIVTQLPPAERAKLLRLLEEQDAQVPLPTNSHANKPPRDKRLPSKPMPPGGTEALHWISTHRREVAGQWVALDGERLIAASPDHEEVFAAARADATPLPLITFVEDPEHYVQLIWA